MAELSSERRLLLAFALSFLVMAGWAAYMRNKYPPPAVVPEPGPPVTTQPAAPAAPVPAAVKPAETKQEIREAPAGAARPEVKQAREARRIAVETAVATIVFSNRGAVVESWRLKNYRDAKGEPLDLVRAGHTELGAPLSLALANPQQEEALNQALFVVNTPATELRAPAELVFQWSDGRLAARKRVRLEQGYLSEIETRVEDGGQPVEHGLAWRGGFGEHGGKPSGTSGLEAQVFVRTPAGLKRQPARVAGQTTGWLWRSPSPFPYSGEGAYAGIEDRYFAAVFLPRQPELRVTAWTKAWTPPGEKEAIPVGTLAVSAGNGPGTRFRLFVGPKEPDTLKSVEPPLLARGAVATLADELVDFGWFWWVAQPLLWLMNWMHGRWIANYGWVIVLLTVLINTALFPLKWQSMMSAWKMQKIAPQVKAIQAKYKQYRLNDPRKQEMQQEMMALYKEHGVNPIGGCFPLLLQLPFFIGFYKVLDVAIELRQAPWVLWIHDLSQKDPYYVLPVVMTLSMYVSTRMTPMTTTDPAQQRLMRLFPLMFGIMFVNLSAGLVLYWLVSGVVGIGQQWWINNHQRKRELAEKLAAKERKKKKRVQGQPSEGNKTGGATL